MDKVVKVKRTHNLHWFRRGLRFHDNPSLNAILSTGSAKTLRFIYILDPCLAGSSQASVNKWRFLLQSLEDLDLSLRKFNSRLYLVRGQPTQVFPSILKKWRINVLSFEEDPELYGQERDAAIKRLAHDLGVSVISKCSHTLYDYSQYRGKMSPLNFLAFLKLVENKEAPTKPCPMINHSSFKGVSFPLLENHDDIYGIPTLEDLGFETCSVIVQSDVWRGGETEALLRLDRHLERRAYISHFGQTNASTKFAFFKHQTSLSPYLMLGCLSIRLFYWKLHELYCKIKGETSAPVEYFGQLWWREFFYCIALSSKEFDKMKGNSLCIQINWDRNPKVLAKWAEGKTGYPWIDAIMIQLRQEGWIHPLCRLSVISFLTRGDLFQSWEDGQKVFHELLLDADWASNAANWLWLSGSSFFHKFYPVCCPVKFGQKLDPHGDYIKHYLPELKNYPTQFIHTPWLATESIQNACKCIIGRDYPIPIIDHEKMAAINADRMQNVYLELFNQLDVIFNKYSQGNKSTPIELNRTSYQESDTVSSQSVPAASCGGSSSVFTQVKRVFSSSSSSEEMDNILKRLNPGCILDEAVAAIEEELYA